MRADLVGHAGPTAVIQIVSRCALIRAGLTITTQTAVDDLRVAARDGVVAYTQALHDARTKALHQNIGLLAQPKQDINACGLL